MKLGPLQYVVRPLDVFSILFSLHDTRDVLLFSCGALRVRYFLQVYHHSLNKRCVKIALHLTR